MVPSNNPWKTVQSYLLIMGRTIRAHNFIIHPNGRLYGDARRLSYINWFANDDKLFIVDCQGKVRFIFERMDNGSWKNAASPMPLLQNRAQKDALTIDGRGTMTVYLPRNEHQLVLQELAAEKNQFEIVVAKFREDVAWTDSYATNVTIYSKDSQDQGRHLTLLNLGREGGTYFHHIVARYDSLADRTLFLQGDPFPHSMLSIPEYQTTDGPFISGESHTQAIDWTMYWSSASQRIDQAVMIDFLRLVECDPTISNFQWTQGAQFAVSREQIRKRPLAYYQRMFDVTQQQYTTLAGRVFDNHHMAWLFELFWRNIFMDPR